MGRSRRAKTYAAALTAVVATAVAGCSDGSPEPKPLDPVTSSAGESSTPGQDGSPTGGDAGSPGATDSPDGPPTLPPEARGTSEKAAEAFVLFWVDRLNYSAATLETGPLAKLSAPSCRACHGAIEAIDRVERGGGSITGGAWHVDESQVVPSDTEERLRVQTVITYSKQIVKRSPQSRPLRYDAGRAFYSFEIRPTEQSWLMTEITGGEST